MSRSVNRRYGNAGLIVMAFALSSSGFAADWPMLGRDLTRNAVSLETNPPLDWNIGKFDRTTGRFNDSSRYNVLWSAKLGSMTVGDPVVADGLIWIGTNNYEIYRDRQKTTDASVLACFRESDGELLYKYVSPRLPRGRIHDWPTSSMACSPLIEGERLWFVTNRCETVCLDIGPLKRQEGEPRVVWKLDMIGKLGVFPRGSYMAISHICSVAADKNRLYVSTGNGVDYSRTVPAPTAPSLLCLDKSTGEVLWQDNSPGVNLLNGQWSSPLVAEIAGRVQVIAAQGDGWVRSFDAITGVLIWKFDMNPKTSRWRVGGDGDRNNILATPVLYEDHIYIGVGQHPADGGDGLGRLCCIDATKTGDISKELAVDRDDTPLAHRRVQAVDPDEDEKAIINPDSGLLWEYIEHDQNGDGHIDFEEEFHRTLTSVAIKNGLLLAADYSGLVHCFDARSGKRYWFYDVLADFVRADSDLVCLKSTDGAELWRKSYLKDFGAGRPIWGHCDFPLVDEGRLVISPGSPEVGIAALNKLTGEEIWKTKIPGIERAGHAAVVAATFDNVRQYLIYSDKGLFGVHATDGQILWHYDQVQVNYGNSHTPIVQGDRIFHTSYRNGVAALKVIAENSDFHIEEIYHQTKLALDPFHDTLTLVDDHIYGFRRSGMMLCFSASTGELCWGPRRREPLTKSAPVDAPQRRQRASQASLTYADSNLYLRYSDGTITLVEANPNEYVEKGKFEIPDHEDALGATAPVIAGGRMYVRDDNGLFCYQLRTDVASAKPPRIVQVTIEKDEILDTQHERGGPRSVFVPTPHDVVEKMLTMASVRKQDTVYDLGSGDGRIVITAAKQYGSRAVGIEIDRELVEISQAKAEQAGVASKATFQRRDIFTADVSAADVIVLYLLPNQLERLLPQLQKLNDGARIVSHQFAIPGIEPDKVLEVESQDDGETHKLFLWTAPLRSLHE